MTFRNLHLSNDEISSYQTLIYKFSNSSVEEVQTQVAMAHCNMGVAYGRNNDYENEINSYQTLIDKLGASSFWKLKLRWREHIET